jgi:CTP:molybdopterin cytidylyltransferase MocA
VTVAPVVLAAGLGTRFDGDTPKLLAPFRGRPLAAWALDAAATVGPPIVVVGETDLTAVLPPGSVVVVNPDPGGGQATSLALGLEAVAAAGHDAAVVGLADQPLVPAAAWQRVAASDADLATASFRGRRRPPVRLGRAVWRLVPTEGDEGARALMRERPDLVTEIPCEGEPADVDTVEDLARWS